MPKFKLVEFNTGKVGARYFDFNPFRFGYWYLHKSKTGETVSRTRLNYFVESGVQFDNFVDVSFAIDQYQKQHSSSLVVVKK